MAQLVARLNGIQKVRGSNPLSSTKRNLKRTPFGENSFRFFLFAVVFSRCDIESFGSRLKRVCKYQVCFLAIMKKRQFMPRKPLDVRKAYGRLFANGKQKPLGAFSLGSLPEYHTPQRLASSGTWNK